MLPLNANIFTVLQILLINKSRNLCIYYFLLWTYTTHNGLLKKNNNNKKHHQQQKTLSITCRVNFEPKFLHSPRQSWYFSYKFTRVAWFMIATRVFKKYLSFFLEELWDLHGISKFSLCFFMLISTVFWEFIFLFLS